MAEFTITFDEVIVIPGPEYENYFVGTDTVCGSDGIPRSIKFNDLSGDFIVGYNWTNPLGFPATTIRITDFTDNMYERIGGVDTINPMWVPTNMTDNSTGLPLTYPYTTPLTNLPNIIQDISSGEVWCPDTGDTNDIGVRIRTIDYVLIDSDGNEGPIRRATFQNLGYWV